MYVMKQALFNGNSSLGMLVLETETKSMLYNSASQVCELGCQKVGTLTATDVLIKVPTTDATVPPKCDLTGRVPLLYQYKSHFCCYSYVCTQGTLYGYYTGEVPQDRNSQSLTFAQNSATYWHLFQIGKEVLLLPHSLQKTCKDY